MRATFGALLLTTLAACTVTPLPRRAPPVIVQPAPLPAPVPGPSAAEPQPADLAAFKAVLTARDVVPPADSPAQGELVAVLNRRTGLLQWKMSFSQLSGPVRGAHFHSPAMSGEVAAPVISLGRGFASPYDGRAMLTPRQRNDLLTGQWYVNLVTEHFPDGELRGQMIEQR